MILVRWRHNLGKGRWIHLWLFSSLCQTLCWRKSFCIYYTLNNLFHSNGILEMVGTLPRLKIHEDSNLAESCLRTRYAITYRMQSAIRRLADIQSPPVPTVRWSASFSSMASIACFAANSATLSVSTQKPLLYFLIVPSKAGGARSWSVNPGSWRNGPLWRSNILADIFSKASGISSTNAAKSSLFSSSVLWLSITMAWSHRKLEWDTAPMQSYLWHMDANLAIESGSRALGMPYIWWCAILQSNVKVPVSSSGKAMTGGVRDLLAGRFSGTKMAKLSDADECLLWRAWVSQAQTFSRTGETKLRTLDETSRCVLTSASSGDHNSKTTSPLPSIMMAFVSVSEVSLTSGASIIARNLWGWALKFSRDSSISCAKHQCSGGVECKIGLEASVSVTYVPARSIPILKRSDVICWRRPTRPFIPLSSPKIWYSFWTLGYLDLLSYVSSAKPFVTDFTANSSNQ